MTSPGDVTAPDGAWELGSTFGQGETEQSVREAIRTPNLNPWSLAQDAFGARRGYEYATLATRKDGQNGLSDRLDLIREISGYACSFMGYTWALVPNKWLVVPFETRLGPAKNAEVITPENNAGWMRLKAGGLWRVDTHLTISAFSQTAYIGGNPPILITQNYGIKAMYLIEVIGPDGQLWSARQYEALNEYAVESANGLGGTVFPVSSAFNHTFVLPEMPPPDHPNAPEYWYQVRVSVRCESTMGGSFYGVMVGGTNQSSLICARWSRETDNANAPATVPDGGTLS